MVLFTNPSARAGYDTRSIFKRSLTGLNSEFSLNLLCHSKIDARSRQDGRKAIWSITYVSVASFFPSLKQNFIAYRTSKVSSRPDCIFEIHQQWQSGFSRVYSNCCCSCSFEAEIINIGQSSHKMHRNSQLNIQESITILNACTKNSGNLLKAPLIGCPCGVMVKAMNCGIVVREFVLQSRYYVHFRANTLGKGMNPLILPPAMGK